MILRKQIVEAARSCVGTPFMHEGRINGRGLDCLGLPLRVAEDCDIKDVLGIPILTTDYHGQYSEQPNDNFLHREAARRLKRASREHIQPGNVVTMRSPSITCHIGIVGFLLGSLTLIHVCSQGPNRCIEETLSLRWMDRIIGVFDFPGVGGPLSLA